MNNSSNRLNFNYSCNYRKIIHDIRESRHHKYFIHLAAHKPFYLVVGIRSLSFSIHWLPHLLIVHSVLKLLTGLAKAAFTA